VLVRPGKKALERAVNQFRLRLLQRVVSKTQLVHRAGPEVFGHHVGALDQLQHDIAALLRLEVDRDALLVAVVGWKKSRAGSGQLAGMVAVKRFDLDHFRTQIGQHQPAGRSHHHVHELDHAHTLQRQIHCLFPL